MSSNLLVNRLFEFGPQVAIIDDNESEVESIEDTLNDLNIGNIFFKVDSIERVFPEKPLDNVELVFLDLHYDEMYGAGFDPEFCCDWLKHVVPANKSYVLVIWSNDTGLYDELYDTMQRLGNIPMPFITIIKSKNTYRTGNGKYDIEKLLSEVNTKFNSYEVNIEEYLGQVLVIEDEDVLVNCIINKEPKIFEVRKFDSILFSGLPNYRENVFVNITVTTKPNTRTIIIRSANADYSSEFVKEDFEGDFNDIEWLNDPI